MTYRLVQGKEKHSPVDKALVVGDNYGRSRAEHCPDRLERSSREPLDARGPKAGRTVAPAPRSGPDHDEWPEEEGDAAETTRALMP